MWGRGICRKHDFDCYLTFHFYFAESRRPKEGYIALEGAADVFEKLMDVGPRICGCFSIVYIHASTWSNIFQYFFSECSKFN
jgi:hypothetical protein